MTGKAVDDGGYDKRRDNTASNDPSHTSVPDATGLEHNLGWV